MIIKTLKRINAKLILEMPLTREENEVIALCNTITDTNREQAVNKLQKGLSKAYDDLLRGLRKC